MDIWDYFERHQRECRSLGLVESDNFPIQYFAMEGRNDMRGLILGRYDLGDRQLDRLDPTGPQPSRNRRGHLRRRESPLERVGRNQRRTDQRRPSIT